MLWIEMNDVRNMWPFEAERHPIINGFTCVVDASIEFYCFPQTRLREYSAPDLFVIDAVVNLLIKSENPSGPISLLKFVFKPSKIPVFVCCLISPRALLDNVIITRQSISKTKKLRRSCRLKCTAGLITTCPILSWESYQNLEILVLGVWEGVCNAMASTFSQACSIFCLDLKTWRPCFQVWLLE